MKRAARVSGVSFMFDLELPFLTPAVGAQIVAGAQRPGAWPVSYVPAREERRWFRVLKAYPAVIEVATSDQVGHVLVDPEDWDRSHWALREDAKPRLIETLDVIARAHPQPFVFRATWSGSPILGDEELDAGALAKLIAGDRLSDSVRYLVAP